jgi:hypothetical protein
MAPSKGQKTRKKLERGAPAPAPSTPYVLEMTESAKAVYVQMHRQCKEAEERGDLSNHNCTSFRMVQDTIKRVIPSDPLNKRYALSGDLSNIFRIKKGRLRICWIASSAQRRICILFISDTPRKEGDVNDPYALFTSMVMSGRFNDVFGTIGVKVPPRSMTPHKTQ